MNIVVCIKQVPDTKGGVKFNPDGTLDRAAMPRPGAETEELDFFIPSGLIF